MTIDNQAARQVLDRAQREPAWFWQYVLGAAPWAKQAEILEAVWRHPRVAVRSCHGAGKSWSAARVVLTFLCAWPDSIVVTTAPTDRQVRKILWQELHKAYRAGKVRIGGELLQTELRFRPGWYAFGFATDVPDNFQGLHAKRLLAVVDEAAGVEPPIWDAVEGILTSQDAHLLAIGNPTDPAGPFARLFKDADVHKVHISAFDTPNLTAFGITEADVAAGTWEAKVAGPLPYPALVTPVWVADKYRRWGPTSPMYQARVKGDFPDVGEDTVIPLSWVEAAQARTLEPIKPGELGVDVARFGTDKTVIVHRCGPVARILSVTSKEDTMETTGRVVAALGKTSATVAKVDVIGVGAGVVDRLVELGKPVAAMNSAEAAADPERFINRRAEWYWGLREMFERGEIDLDGDDELAAQLSSLKYKFTSRGQIQIEPKESLKKRGLSSPDLADALMLAMADGGPQPWEYYEEAEE